MKYNVLKMEDALEALIDYRGKTPEKAEEGIDTLSAKSVKDGYIDYSLCYQISAEEYKRFMVRGFPQIGDILLTTEAPLGLVARLDRNDVAIAQRLLTLRGKKGVLDNDYLMYYLQSPKGQAALTARATGTTVTGIKQAEFRKIELELPDYDYQVKVSGIIRAIDEKIALNKKINNNLYQILAASYKHDYLDSIMTDYQEVTLDDITSKIATGLNPRKNFVLGQGSNYYVTIKNMGDNRIYLDEKCDSIDDDALIKINKRSDLAVGDCLFSGIGTIGRVHLIDTPPTNWNISESVFTLRAATLVSSEFLYLLLLSDDMQGYANALASGSAQKGIRMADLKKYPVFLPNSERMAQLTSYWRPLIQEIKNNERESDQLASIRSSLLPKLLTGDIDVSEVEI